jgi:hypothetical protein
VVSHYNRNTIQAIADGRCAGDIGPNVVA